MRERSLCLAALLVLPWTNSFAQAAAPAGSAPIVVSKPPLGRAGAAPDYKDEALVFEHYSTTVRMKADGTGDRVDHVAVRVQSEGAVRAFGVLAVTYASANSSGKVEHVAVHKPDGTTIATPESDALEMTAPVSRDAPLYSDEKEMQLPVRSLAVGDRLEYDLHTVYLKAEAPGQFWGAERMLPFGTAVVLDRTVELSAPADKYVQVWSPQHASTQTTAAGVRTWHWTASQLKPTPKSTGDKDEDAEAAAKDKDPDEDAQGRKLPSIAWTTFHSWPEVGDWYRSLALDRAEPDAALRARADELTKDAKTPEDQVRALYSFVSGKTRYVGIDLGIGRFQPHAAATVLANQYGDCKDKDTLLEALLRAKGFTVAPALIGAGITPVPDVPSPAVFNHVITTVSLPSGTVWLDSTTEVAPYGLLSAAIRDQEALVVPAKNPAALEKTPAQAPYAFRSDSQAEGEYKSDGSLKAHLRSTYRDDSEVLVRTLARNIAPAEWDKASQYVSYQTGFGGTTSNTRFGAVNDLAQPIELSYDYSNKTYGQVADHLMVPLFPAITISGNQQATRQPEHDIDLGAPRVETAVSRITIPQGWHADLPDAVHAKTAWITLDKTYRVDGQNVVAERKLTVLQEKLPKAEWKQYQAFSKDSDVGNEAWITLVPAKVERPAVSKSETVTKDANGNSTTIVHLGEAKDVPTAPADADMPTLKRTAAQQLQNGEIGAARATLDRIKTKNPNEPGLVGLYGAVAEQNGNWDEALTDYRKELASQPENAFAAMAVAQAQHHEGQKAEARETLQHYFATHPDNQIIGFRLAALQTEAGRNDEAAATTRKLVEAHPDDRNLQVQLANALVAANRMDEAAAVARAVLDGTDDPGLLNDAGYALAETGHDLPQAEEVSRKSIAKLEEKSRAIVPDEVNSTAFRESNLLIAAWDTLGWIFYEEGKYADAKPLLFAAWRNDLQPEVGNHLAQLYEKEGDRRAALQQYRLGSAAIEANNSTQAVRDHLNDSVGRLAKELEPPKPLPKADVAVTATPPKSLWSYRNQDKEALQDSRTYKLPRPKDAGGYGTFRIQLKADGVQAVLQASGDPRLKQMEPALKAMRFPELVPPGSGAYLLRSGVLSCSGGSTCELVLVPNGNLQTERE